MMVTISWGWVRNQEFYFGYFEFEMTINHSSRYLFEETIKQKSQEEAQKGAMAADKI